MTQCPFLLPTVLQENKVSESSTSSCWGSTTFLQASYTCTLTFQKRHYPEVLLLSQHRSVCSGQCPLYSSSRMEVKWLFWYSMISRYLCPSTVSFPDSSENLRPQDQTFVMVLFLLPLEDTCIVHQTDPTEKSD